MHCLRREVAARRGSRGRAATARDLSERASRRGGRVGPAAAQVDAFLDGQWQIRAARARPPVSQRPRSRSSVDDGQSVGRLLGPTRISERWLLVDIALLPEARGRGPSQARYCRALIADRRAARRVPVLLSVTRGNRAQRSPTGSAFAATASERSSMCGMTCCPQGAPKGDPRSIEERTMSEPFIRRDRMFAGNFPPRGWALCNGQLSRSKNKTQRCFRLGHHLRRRRPKHLWVAQPAEPRADTLGTGTRLSNYVLGEQIGTENVTILARTCRRTPTQRRCLAADTRPRHHQLSRGGRARRRGLVQTMPLRPTRP